MGKLYLFTSKGREGGGREREEEGEGLAREERGEASPQYFSLEPPVAGQLRAHGDVYVLSR